jgi:hypothetical protein
MAHFTGPHGPLKMPKMHDTWQPLVFPCQHVDAYADVSTVWTLPDLPICPKFQMAITFASGVCLRCCLRSWKALVKLFDLVLFFSNSRHFDF